MPATKHQAIYFKVFAKEIQGGETSATAPEWVDLQVTEKATIASDATIMIHAETFWVEISERFAPSKLLDVLKT